MVAKIKFLNQEYKDEIFPLNEQDTFTFGTSSSCDMVAPVDFNEIIAPVHFTFYFCDTSLCYIVTASYGDDFCCLANVNTLEQHEQVFSKQSNPLEKEQVTFIMGFDNFSYVLIFTHEGYSEKCFSGNTAVFGVKEQRRKEFNDQVIYNSIQKSTDFYKGLRNATIEKKRWDFFLSFFIKLVDGNVLCGIYIFDVTIEYYKEARISNFKKHEASNSVIKKCIKLGKPIKTNVGGKAHDIKFKGKNLTLIGNNVSSAMTFPIKRGSKIVAVLYIENRNNVRELDFQTIVCLMYHMGVESSILFCLEKYKQVGLINGVAKTNKKRAL